VPVPVPLHAGRAPPTAPARPRVRGSAGSRAALRAPAVPLIPPGVGLRRGCASVVASGGNRQVPDPSLLPVAPGCRRLSDCHDVGRCREPSYTQLAGLASPHAPVRLGSGLASLVDLTGFEPAST
jgi:hypothetical protein